MEVKKLGNFERVSVRGVGGGDGGMKKNSKWSSRVRTDDAQINFKSYF